MAERALGSVESGSAIFERTVAEGLSEIEVGELPLFDEVKCGSAVPPLPQGGEEKLIGRRLLKSCILNGCEVLGEIGRNGSEEVVSNAFQNRIVVACALFLFGISQCAEPCLALRRCPFGPHIAKVEEILHEIFRALGAREKIERFRNDARGFQIDQERA